MQCDETTTLSSGRQDGVAGTRTELSAHVGMPTGGGVVVRCVNGGCGEPVPHRGNGCACGACPLPSEATAASCHASHARRLMSWAVQRLALEPRTVWADDVLDSHKAPTVGTILNNKGLCQPGLPLMGMRKVLFLLSETEHRLRRVRLSCEQILLSSSK